MTAKAHHPLSGSALALGSAVFLSAKGIVMKLALHAGGGVEQVMALRMGIALPIFLVVGIISARKTERDIKPSIWLYACGLGILSHHVCTWLDFQGLKLISAQLGRLILFLYPTFVALFAAIFLKDRMTLRHAGALGLSYVGVFILFGQELSVEGGNIALGGLFELACAILYACFITGSKPIIARMGSALFTSVAMSAAAISILVHYTIRAASVGNPPMTMEIVWLGAILAIVCTVLPSFLMAEAIARIGPGPSSAIGSAGPVFTSIMAVLILTEPFGWAQGVALVLTLGGIALLSSEKARVARPASLPRP